MAQWSVTHRTRTLLHRFQAAVRWSDVADRISEQMGARDRAIWAMALCFLFLDILTTWYGLQLGLRESNVVAVRLLSQFGYLGLASIKVVAMGIGFVGWSILPVSARFIAPSCLAVPWGLASGYNTLLIAGLLAG